MYHSPKRNVRIAKEGVGYKAITSNYTILSKWFSCVKGRGSLELNRSYLGKIRLTQIIYVFSN